VAKAAHLLNRAALLKIEALNVPFVIKAHEIWEIMHLLPRDRFFCFPVLK
jgi:hypothetical protein